MAAAANPKRPYARLLNPTSIAVVGGGWAAAVIEQSERMGFAGDIWPVHPTRAEVRGRRAYASINDLPAAPDATFIGVNRQTTIDVVRDLAACGAGGATCFAAGWAETDDGGALQDQLLAAAGDMPIFGPNCYGLINYLSGATLWPDVHGGERVERGVALICQSSNIAINLSMQQRSLPLAYVLTVGNGAQVSLGNMIEAMAAEDSVTAIGLYIEGFGDPVAFIEAVRFAHERGVAVVALKAGQSDGGQALTLTHTATLAGGAAVSTALLSRLGVAEVSTLTSLLETLKILHFKGPLDSRRVMSVSCSGGEAGLMADLGSALGLDYPPLSEAEAARIGASLNRLVTVSNPFDYNTFDWGDADALGAMWDGILAVDVSHPMLVIDWPRAGTGPTHTWDIAIEAVASALDITDRKAGVPALVSSLPESMPPEAAAKISALGLIPGHGLEDHLTAVAGAADIGAFRAAPPALPYVLPGAGPEGAVMLDEAQAKAALAAHGLPTPPHAVCTSVDEVAAAVADFGASAVKILGDFAHKTELGGVLLGIADEDAARAAASDLLALSDRVLVEPMAAKPLAELILGVARDPVVGLHLVIGAGGVLTEILQDSTILLFPVDEKAVRQALEGLKVWPLLTGYRGALPADIEALVAAVLALAAFVEAEQQRLVELDINPLFVHAKGEAAGVSVVDALIRFSPDRTPPRRVTL
ncbi:MAG: acyl-CoA synthetase [Geminicoccus sp.]|nr:acyl-CoA synthetase [Geminicoccus sp.]